jgi:hypothetical protein
VTITTRGTIGTADQLTAARSTVTDLLLLTLFDENDLTFRVTAVDKDVVPIGSCEESDSECRLVQARLEVM